MIKLANLLYILLSVAVYSIFSTPWVVGVYSGILIVTGVFLLIANIISFICWLEK